MFDPTGLVPVVKEVGKGIVLHPTFASTGTRPVGGTNNMHSTSHDPED